MGAASRYAAAFWSEESEDSKVIPAFQNVMKVYL